MSYGHRGVRKFYALFYCFNFPLRDMMLGDITHFLKPEHIARFEDGDFQTREIGGTGL